MLTYTSFLCDVQYNVCNPLVVSMLSLSKVYVKAVIYVKVVNELYVKAVNGLYKSCQLTIYERCQLTVYESCQFTYVKAINGYM